MGPVGAAGGETTFGDLSSAQGASSEIGYVDPVTEEELAKPGTEGVDGAAGGRGGQASSRGGDYGENGEDVPPNTGGPGGPPYGWKFDDYTSENVRIYGGGAGGGAAHGKDGEPGSDSPTAVGGAGRPLMYPNARTKLELEEMAGTAVAVAVGPEDCLHLRRLMAVRITGRYLDHEGRRIGGERVSWFKWRAGRCNPVFWSEKKTGFRPDPG